MIFTAYSVFFFEPFSIFKAYLMYAAYSNQHQWAKNWQNPRVSPGFGGTSRPWIRNWQRFSAPFFAEGTTTTGSG
jgi:hypothetical protein